jgi:carbamoyl-phosphate synthase small subunit
LKTGYLVLEDGFYLEGETLGEDNVLGEVVFNTTPSGYEEVVTDPSYFNQIVVFTSPMIGNYGSHPEQWESSCYQAKAIICLELQDTYRDRAFLKELKKQKRGILKSVDTRKLTLYLRNKGTVWGVLVQAENSDQALAKASLEFKKKSSLPQDWVFEVSRPHIEIKEGHQPQGPRVGILDFGVKKNIIRQVQQYSRSVILFPSRTPVDVILAHRIEGLILSNGPGDPASVLDAPVTVEALLGQIPMLAICMGHQILARALKAQTYKLKFGHRGANHPILDKVLNQIYVASHNHGYAVDEKTLPPQAQVTMINLNDQTLAGFILPDKKVVSVQYHPEGCPGPLEVLELFSYFFEEILEYEYC